MTRHGTQIIETDRLILRPFTKEDSSPMFTNWACDKEVTKFLTWPAHSSKEISEMILADWTAQYSNPDYYQWAVVPKDNQNEPVGSISVVSMDPQIQKAEIGYCIGRNWWHQGYTSEALQAVIDYLFASEGFNRVESRHDPNNPNSGKVMAKCGMKYEGTLRQADWNNQGIVDCSHYGLLKSEWKTLSSRRQPVKLAK